MRLGREPGSGNGKPLSFNLMFARQHMKMLLTTVKHKLVNYGAEKNMFGLLELAKAVVRFLLLTPNQHVPAT